MNQLLSLFVTESRELLEIAGKGLLAMEKNPDDSDSLKAVFRATHTIKSSSGMFEFKVMTVLAHAMEELLVLLREGKLNLTPEMVDQLLDAFDQINQWVDQIETDESMPPDAEQAADVLIQGLRVLIPDALVGEESPMAKAPPSGLEAPLARETGEVRGQRVIDWLAPLSEQARLKLLQETAVPGKVLTVIRYTPDPQCFFAGEDPFAIMRQLPQALLLHVEPVDPWPSLEEMNPYSCRLRFLSVSQASETTLKDHLSALGAQIETAAISPLSLAFVFPIPPASKAGATLAKRLASVLEQDNLEQFRVLVDKELGKSSVSVQIRSALRWMQIIAASELAATESLQPMLELLRNGGLPRWEADVSSPISELHEKSSEEEQGMQDAFIHLIQEQIKLLSLPSETTLWKGIVGSVARVAVNCLSCLGRGEEISRIEQALHAACEQHNTKPLSTALGQLLKEEPQPLAQPEEEAPEEVVPLDGKRVTLSRTLKVDQARIDTLMELIGELVVANNSLPYLADKAENIYGVRELSRELKEKYSGIGYIAKELQSSIMQVRMLPISQILQQMPRMVRDHARELGKEIELVMEGQETEVDKNIIEQLAEPLTHLIRNSISHGIEPPEMRQKLGKRPAGKIRIRAWQESDKIFLEVSDDGYGIDAEVVRKKAMEMGVDEPETLAAMSDQEVIQYIFHAGLSTAIQVSGLSGRGVGMDVVRTTAESLGGEVLLQSTKGQGAVVTMSLPMSVSISRVMTFSVCGQKFGIPIDTVTETLRLPLQDAQHIKDNRIFSWRGRTVPLVPLAKLLQLERDDEHPVSDEEETAVLVVKYMGDYAGLIVNEFHEGMDVTLKPMEGILATMDVYSGTALLGDGSVLLVINLQELL